MRFMVISFSVKVRLVILLSLYNNVHNIHCTIYTYNEGNRLGFNVTSGVFRGGELGVTLSIFVFIF